MKTIVVIPAFNEESTIEKVVCDVRTVVSDVVVVDDGSSDSTATHAQRGGATVLRHFINRGQGASLKTGIVKALASDADIIVTFDADGQHEVSDIEKLIAPIAHREVDVVLGSRFMNNTTVNIPVLRRVVLKTAVLFSSLVSGLRLTDTHNGLRAFSRKAAETLRIRQDRMAHASEILDEISEKNLPFREVSVTVRYSEYSKMKGQSSSAFAKILFKYFMGRLLR
ncbi:MAG: glycosyltransferase family 2 protein [bacterium]